MSNLGDAMDVDSPSKNGIQNDSDYSRKTHDSSSSIGYVYSAEMTQHFYTGDKGPTSHVEQPERIMRIHAMMLERGYTQKMSLLKIRPVEKYEALLVHTDDHWNKVLALQNITEQEIVDTHDFYESLSLYVMPGSTRAARLSCGGVIEAALSVARGEMKKAVAVVRPPGHHAEPDQHMGFCFFNNVAVASRVVQQATSVKRILIVDWDVHHGNGTHAAFESDPSVLYLSLHRYEGGTFYPTGPMGDITSCGAEAGKGFCVNIPWPSAGMGDAEYIYAFQKIVLPIAMEFAPELVIISAGFDAALGDPLGENEVSPAGYAHMTHMLAGLAGGKLVVALEGGYNIDSTANSMIAVMGVLLGESPGELPPLVVSEIGMETVYQVAKEQSKYWKNIDASSCDPQDDYEESTFSIPEILKAHRQYYLASNFDLMQIPLAPEELDERFSCQVMATPNILENKPMIVFIHEFGNLRAELEGSATCDLALEKSYIIDFSKKMLSWIISAKYSLIDINLFPSPISAKATHPRKSSSELSRDIMTYLWDNYIQISDAKKIMLVGHGPGCAALIQLLSERFNSIKLRVQGVIQVIGLGNIPPVPKHSEPDLKLWYEKNSLVIIPSSHPINTSAMKIKDLKRHGSLIPIDEVKPIKLIITALPVIQDYVTEKMSV